MKNEGDLIVKQNPGFFKETNRTVALARAYAVLKKISDSQGMIVPLAEVNKTLALPGFEGITVH